MEGLENRIKTTFSAINSEFKALLLGFVLRRDYYLTTQEVKETAEFLADDSGERLPKDLNAYRSHLDFVSDRSRVSLFVEKQEEPLGWKLDDSDIPIAAIARFALYSTIKFNLGLTSWLGQPKDGGCYNSVNILRKLRENGEYQVAELARQMEASESAVSTKIKKFKDLGLLTLDSLGPGTKGCIRYRSLGIPISPGETFKNKCAQRILEVTDDLPQEFNYLDVLAACQIKTESYIQSGLRELERKGYIVATTPWVGHRKYSEIALTERGRQLHDDFVERVIAVLDDDGKALVYVRRKAIFPQNIPRALNFYSPR